MNTPGGYVQGDLVVVRELSDDFFEHLVAYIVTEYPSLGEVRIGSRTELLDLRNDIDQALEEMP